MEGKERKRKLEVEEKLGRREKKGINGVVKEEKPRKVRKRKGIIRIITTHWLLFSTFLKFIHIISLRETF